MKYIDDVPIAIVSSNATDESYPSWNTTTTYTALEMIIDDYIIYECLQPNTNKKPSLNPLYFKKQGVVNSRKVIDEFVNSQTIQTDLTFTVRCDGWVDTIALFNVEALKIEVIQGEYVFSQYLIEVDIINWGDYFINPITAKNDGLIYMPLLLAGEITVKLTGVNAKCGVFVAGRIKDLGISLWGSKVGFTDYSKVATNEDGLTTYEQGRFAKRGSFPVQFPTEQVDNILKRITKRRGKLTVYVGDDKGTIESSVIYGFASECEPTIENIETSNYTIEIKGVA